MKLQSQGKCLFSKMNSKSAFCFWVNKLQKCICFSLSVALKKISRFLFQNETSKDVSDRISFQSKLFEYVSSPRNAFSINVGLLISFLFCEIPSQFQAKSGKSLIKL